MQLPMKTELFLIIYRAGDEGIWTDEATKMLSDKCGKTGEYWTGTFGFWYLMMAANGIIEQTEQKPNADGTDIITKYRVTNLGKYRKNEMLGDEA